MLQGSKYVKNNLYLGPKVYRYDLFGASCTPTDEMA